MALTLQEIATLVGGSLAGDGSIPIRGVNSVEAAGADELAALEDARLVQVARDGGAGAYLVAPELAGALDRPRVSVSCPQVALNLVIDRLGLSVAESFSGIHATAVLHPEARLGEGVAVGPYAVVGRAQIGAGSRIHAHAVIHGGAVLGERCEVHPHAVIWDAVRIGNDCLIGPSAVIGAIGFGFGFGPSGPVRLRHLGRVELGDRVEVAALTNIDRARFGVTRVGNDVKIDTQVMVAHNCTVGDRTILAGQVGLAGSSQVGSDCLLGGQAGLAGHLTVASRVAVAAQAGVWKDIPKPGRYIGFPAKERNQAIRELLALERLPAALQEIKHLRAEIQKLKDRLEADGQ